MSIVAPNGSNVVVILAETVRQLRECRGLDQKQLAGLVKTSHSRISDIENGKGNPTLETLQRLAVALGTTVEYLVREKKSRKK